MIAQGARVARRTAGPSAVMVGDRVHDVRGCRARTGSTAIGVTWGYAAPGELCGARVRRRDRRDTPAGLLDAVLAAECDSAAA